VCSSDLLIINRQGIRLSKFSSTITFYLPYSYLKFAVNHIKIEGLFL
jgi:hypothetical protein